MNGTWTSDASGIQCALDAIGRTGFAGIGPADLGEDPDEVHVEAVAGRQLAGDVHVVEGIGVGRVREPGGDHQPRHEREQVQGDGRPHCRCSLAPGPVAAEGYEGATGGSPGEPHEPATWAGTVAS